MKYKYGTPKNIKEVIEHLTQSIPAENIYTYGPKIFQEFINNKAQIMMRHAKNKHEEFIIKEFCRLLNKVGEDD